MRSIIGVSALVLSVQLDAVAKVDRVFHVASNGRDGWSGLVEAPGPVRADGPFATLARAQLAAREALAVGESVGVVVHEGIYRLSQPLVFDSRDCAAAGQVVWRAVGEVTLSGGVRLGDPEVRDSATWSFDRPADLTEHAPTQLFVDGRRATPARTPNEGWFRVEQPGDDGRTSFRYRDNDLTGLTPDADASIVFLHDWSISRVGIASIDEAASKVVLRNRIGAYHPFFHITGFEPHPRYFVEHVPEALDQPGEWTLDETGKRLLLRPSPEQQRDGARVICPRLERLLEVRGTPSDPAQGLRLVGFAFAETAWVRPAQGFAGIQAGFFDERPRSSDSEGIPSVAAVRLEYAYDCVFERCTFLRLGGSGLWLGRGCRRGRVLGCRFADIGANAVMLGEPESPAAPVDLVSEVVLEDSTIERCGAVDFGAVGVWIGIAEHCVVQHNEVHHLPYTGISLGWIWSPTPSASRGHRIRNNHIHHVMQRLSDGGGIYTLGSQPDTVLSGNLIHDVPINQGRAGSNAIFMDQGSSHLRVESNTIFAIASHPIRFHLAGPNQIRDNSLAVAEGVSPFAAHACRLEDQDYSNNRVVTAEALAVEGTAEGAGPRR